MEIADPIPSIQNIQNDVSQSVGTLVTLDDAQKVKIPQIDNQALFQEVQVMSEDDNPGSFSPMSAGSPEGRVSLSMAIG